MQRVIATLNRLPLPLRKRIAGIADPGGHHGREEDHIALVALEAVNRINDELQSREGFFEGRGPGEPRCGPGWPVRETASSNT